MPPTLGGKSLVTSRCDTGGSLSLSWGAASTGAASSARTSGSVVGGEPASASTRSSRPRRRAAHTACARTRGSPAARAAAQGGRHPRHRRGRPRCRARPGRCDDAAGSRSGMYQRSTRSITSSSVAVSSHPTSIHDREVPGHVGPPALHRVRDITKVLGITVVFGIAATPSRRTELLTVVAAIDAVAQSPTEPTREVARSTGGARTGTDPRRRHPAGDDGARRTAHQRQRRHVAPPVGDGLRRWAQVGGEVSDRPEEEPTPLPRQQDVGVLAVPPESGAVGGLAVDEGVVVGEHTRPPPGGLQVPGDDREGGLQRPVVVLPGVAGDAASGPGRSTGVGRGASVVRRVEGAPVAAGADDERPGVGQGAWSGRSSGRGAGR